jgi:hypothetical protein
MRKDQRQSKANTTTPHTRERFVAQMVMWRKAGDRFGVGKKERPMGARLAHA